MRKRVVFLDQSLSCGGAERVLCTVMRSLDAVSFDIHLVVVSSLGQLAHLVPDHVSIHELKIEHTRKALPAFIKLIYEIKPDIVFSSLSRTTVLAAAARFFCPKYRLIARYPTMPGLAIQEGAIQGWRLRVMRFFYKQVDVIVAQTEEMADDLVATLGVSNNRIVTIHNPLDLCVIDQSIVNQVSPYCNDRRNILAVGSLSNAKGFDVLLMAFKKAFEKRRDLHLHFVGRDTIENDGKLQALAYSLGIRDRVTFHGFQENPYRYIKFCDLFVMSSRREGFPNVLLEALYLERPVLVTRCVPVVDRLVGQSGVVVDVDDVKGMALGILEHDCMSEYPSSFKYDMCIWKSVFG